MKIKTKHYNKLKSLIQDVVNKKTLKVVQDYKLSLKTDDRIKDLDTRFAFDLYNATGIEGLNLVCNEIYKYANDDHLKTALKKIVKEIGV